MNTEILPVDPLDPSSEILARAGSLIRAGQLVAFPTETVYGLGANAFDAEAVRAIYTAKGRPANNPVIVHVPSVQEAQPLVSSWPAVADRLAQRFWPGPLTLVLSKAASIPDIVTAGGPTVALRVPSHPVALALLTSAKVPVAAPSANPSNEVSATTAKHVLRGLSGRISLVLDGGASPGGIESTVLDVTTTPPRLLRPGLLDVTDLEAFLGPVEVSPTISATTLPSPGMLARHYAPRTPITCFEKESEPPFDAADLSLVLLTFGSSPERAGIEVVALPNDPVAAAARLYATLHLIDEAKADRLLVELPPDRPEWLAIRDRLRRAGS